MLNRCIDDHVLVNGLCISEGIRVEANMLQFGRLDCQSSYWVLASSMSKGRAFRLSYVDIDFRNCCRTHTRMPNIMSATFAVIDVAIPTSCNA